jgi:hypothetical protein
MALAYSKQFLVDAFMSRYSAVLTPDKQDSLAKMASDLYDSKGKDKFRVYASLDADAIKVYRANKK